MGGVGALRGGAAAAAQLLHHPHTGCPDAAPAQCSEQLLISFNYAASPAFCVQEDLSHIISNTKRRPRVKPASPPEEDN